MINHLITRNSNMNIKLLSILKSFDLGFYELTESLINEYKIQNAIQLLEKIRLDFSDTLISPLATLRLAFISIELKEFK